MELKKIISRYVPEYVLNGAIRQPKRRDKTEECEDHILLDTCCALSGHQFSKSSLELCDFKDFVSTQLLKAGLNEQVLASIKEVSEEEMLLYGEQNENGNYWDAEDDQTPPVVDDYRNEEFLEISDWNNGTVEPYKASMPFEMIQDVSSEPIEGREM